VESGGFEPPCCFIIQSASTRLVAKFTHCRSATNSVRLVGVISILSVTTIWSYLSDLAATSLSESRDCGHAVKPRESNYCCQLSILVCFLRGMLTNLGVLHPSSNNQSIPFDPLLKGDYPLSLFVPIESHSIKVLMNITSSSPEGHKRLSAGRNELFMDGKD